MPRPLPFTDDQLRDAALLSTSLNDLARRLGLTVGGQTYATLRRHLERLGLGPHLLKAVRPRVAPGVRSWTDDDLRRVVRESRGVSDVLRRLGYAPSGGMHRYIKAKIATLGIDSSHFTGQSWSRGLTAPRGRCARPLETILVAGSTYPSSRLRLRIIAAGLRESRCETCGLTDWLGAPLSLALDHINGDPTDNRLENLRILCPNCHAQTETWCGRSANKRVPVGDAEES